MLTVWQIWVKVKAGKGVYPESRGEGFGGMCFPIQHSGDESHRPWWPQLSGVNSLLVVEEGLWTPPSVWKKATGSLHILLKTKSQPSITANLRRPEQICDPPTSRSATLREQQFWCTFCLLNWAQVRWCLLFLAMQISSLKVSSEG